MEKSKEIREFYDVLEDNMRKFGVTPVHTYEEVEDLRKNRLKGIIDFYGVYRADKMIAASMVFKFQHEVFHTQYLAALQNELDVFPNNYMDTQLIMLAKQENYHYFSFGICTEEHGRVLEEIRRLCTGDEVIHVNVPNAYSLHRIFGGGGCPGTVVMRVVD